MPELPEVETMRRQVAGVAGCRIAGVHSGRSRRRPIGIVPSLPVIRRRVVGATISAVERIGKRVVLVLDTNERLIFEPRMTGLVLLGEPPTREHLRLRIELAGEGPDELKFWDRRGLGSVRLVRPEELATRYGEGRLGPDALALTPETLRQRLGTTRRPIKVALLDQKAVAGVGNLYASEMLHVSKINPLTPARELKPAQWRRLHAAMLAVLESVIEHEGSTLSDGTYRTALNQPGGYQNHHRVYERAEENCLGCRRGVIVRIVQAQRSTFYCPICQR